MGVLKKSIKVSICCLTYNHEAFIAECLEGFLKQKTTFGIEVLVHDDASSDSTAVIIKEYEKKYPEIIKPIYQNKNKFSKEGQGMNIRYNFPRANGEFIALCEGDDYWTDSFKLQKQVEFLEKNLEYLASSHNSYFLDESNQENKRKVFSDLETGKIELRNICPVRNFHTASILFRKKALQNLDLNFLSEKVKSGDKFLFMHFWLTGNIFYDQTLMAVYRRNAGGMSKSKNLNRFMDADIKMYEYFKKRVPEKYKGELEEAKNYFKVNRFNYALENNKNYRLLSYYLALIPITGKSKHLPHLKFKEATKAFLNKILPANG